MILRAVAQIPKVRPIKPTVTCSALPNIRIGVRCAKRTEIPSRSDQNALRECRLSWLRATRTAARPSRAIRSKTTARGIATNSNTDGSDSTGIIKRVDDFFERKELFRRVLITVFILFCFRLMNQTPIPGLDTTLTPAYMGEMQSMLDITHAFTKMGSAAVPSVTLATTGLMPIILSNTILAGMRIISLNFWKAWMLPGLELRSAMEEGGSEMMEYVKSASDAFTVLFAMMFAVYIANSLRPCFLIPCDHLVNLGIVLPLICGTIVTSWLCSELDKRGIGEGLSVVISMSIISSLANSIKTIYLKVVEGALSLNFAAGFFGIFCTSLVTILLLSVGMVKIPISFFRLQSDGKIKATETSVDNEIPVRLNSQGILPLIIAMVLIEQLSFWMPYFAANLSPAMPYSYYPILFFIVFAISQAPIDSTPTSLTTYMKQVRARLASALAPGGE
ncbi:hypothetical protein CYMTET_55706 [Cymbomonas tetramitiformis]|uniref:Uncharacterized protein n=1 Tax=Cymbomonas tetramitiformis TaxID=36881 RepID=A0AAE0ENB1_9CHLO|nr:hypothetical protein CYMTET_55706 [Cymbomonas tetramitiformis]